MFWSNGYVDWKYWVYITVLKAWDQVLKDWPAVLQVWSGCTKCTPSILKLHQNEKNPVLPPSHTQVLLSQWHTHSLPDERTGGNIRQTSVNRAGTRDRVSNCHITLTPKHTCFVFRDWTELAVLSLRYMFISAQVEIIESLWETTENILTAIWTLLWPMNVCNRAVASGVKGGDNSRNFTHKIQELYYIGPCSVNNSNILLVV